MQIRFTKDKLDSLTKKSHKAGLSRENFCRHILNGAVLKEAPSIDSIEMLRELKRIGYNLNQVLKRGNSIGMLDVPELRKVVDEVRLAAASILEAYTTE